MLPKGMSGMVFSLLQGTTQYRVFSSRRIYQGPTVQNVMILGILGIPIIEVFTETIQYSLVVLSPPTMELQVAYVVVLPGESRIE